MINRVIYGGKVYYKVADLAKLFEVSLYKMRRIVKELNIGERLDGFGLAKFVLESNVAKIEVNSKVAVIEPMVITPVETKTVEKSEEAPVKKSTKPAKKAEKKSANANNVVTLPVGNKETAVESNINEIEELQKEHARLLKCGKRLTRKFTKAEKMDIAHEICEKHLGKGNQFIDTTPEDVPQMRLICKELGSALENLKLDGIVTDIINQLPNESEPTTELQPQP